MRDQIYNDMWEYDDPFIQKGYDEGSRLHEKKLSKMSTEKLIRKYGIGIVPEWIREEFKKDNPQWSDWDRGYRCS